jgi:DNA-binding transcriptional regulator YiaG
MSAPAITHGSLVDVREEWRAVPGQEGRYEASSLGQVRSVTHAIRVVRNGRQHSAIVNGRVLGGGLDSSGYRQVCIGRRFRRVSNVVAETFLGPRPAGAFVCHNDGDRTNDALANLRYDTPASNARDRALHGTERRGEHRARAKLTDSIVREIREARGLISQRELAAKYGVSHNTIKQVQLGRTWSHV